MKTLRVVWIISAISICQFARSQSESGIQILQATYGADSAQMDVTDKVQSLVQSGQTNVRVGNHLFGQDPAFGKVKTLSVVFSSGGVQYHSDIRESGQLSFGNAKLDQSNVAPQTSPAPAPRLAGQAEAQTLSPETAMWLVERIAVRTKGGITGVPLGTKVTLIEDRGEKLLVSDGSLKFEATRVQITTDLAVAQSMSASYNSAQSAATSAWNAQVVQQRQAIAKAQQQAVAKAQSNGQDLNSLLFRALTHTTRPDDAALAASLRNSPEAQNIREGIAAMEARAPRSFSPPSPPRPLPNSAGPSALPDIALERLKSAAARPAEESRAKSDAQRIQMQAQSEQEQKRLNLESRLHIYP